MKILLKQFFRNLRSNKLNYFITIIGFSISIAVVLVLTFFIIMEKSYDKDYPNIDNIYMVVTTKNGAFVEEDARDILINKYPQINLACRYLNYDEDIKCENDFYNIQLVSTDEDFFDIFSLQFIIGSKEKAFTNILGIVLTETFAKKIFKNNFPLGKTIKTIDGKNFEITGVVKDLPKYSSIKADCFIHYKSKTFINAINDVSINRLFLLLHSNVIPKDIENEFSETLVESSKILNNKNINYGETIEWKLCPYKSIHFNTEISGDQLIHANIKLIKIISFITIIVLLLAIINYINLSTASGISRIKEIGIRKANGAGNKNIFYQFLFESLSTCIIASTLAFLFAYLLIPVFEILLQKPIDFLILTPLNIALIMFGIFFLGLISGLFPASIASKYPLIQLYSKGKIIFKSASFRNGLNTFQFTVSIILIICLVLIIKQINFVKNRDIGYDESCLVWIHFPGHLSKSNIILEKLNENPNILNVSFTNGSPMKIGSHHGQYGPLKNVSIMSADDKFIETFKFRLIHGRNIHFPSKIKECLITENAFNETGWENLENRFVKDYKVVGVINPFNFGDLHNMVSNVLILNSSNEFYNVSIRMNPHNISESLDYLKTIWETSIPDFGFRYSFYDEWIENSFKNEENHARIALVFGILSIVLSCLGLFGLADYSVKQRMKEIGVRKINGAKIFEIIKLLNTGFLRWIIIAFIIACPFAVVIMNKWLINFAYKTTFDWWVFFIAGFIVSIISLLVISWKIWMAAVRNPVEALRYE